MNGIRIGTRGSKLAMIQAKMLSAHLNSSGITTELIVVETAGDRDKEAPIYTMGGTGVFVSALNEKILSGEIDVAVHSAKDIPTSIPEDIEIAGVLERGPVEDLLVSRTPLERMPKGSVVGTSSLRRSHEILFARPDLEVKSIRGNVDTRIRKYVEGQYDAIILAKAAYDRLGLDENAYVLDVHSFPPAANQGIIAVTAKAGSEYASILRSLSDRMSMTAMLIERTVLMQLKLSCDDPVAVLATGSDPIRLFIRIYSLAGRSYKDFVFTVHDPEEAAGYSSALKEKVPESFGYKWR